ncbi:MAG: hypothetical protein ACRCZJ_09685 [Erysipelotrichaceae bacterium]
MKRGSILLDALFAFFVFLVCVQLLLGWSQLAIQPRESIFYEIPS